MMVVISGVHCHLAQERHKKERKGRPDYMENCHCPLPNTWWNSSALHTLRNRNIFPRGHRCLSGRGTSGGSYVLNIKLFCGNTIWSLKYVSSRLLRT